MGYPPPGWLLLQSHGAQERLLSRGPFCEPVDPWPLHQSFSFSFQALSSDPWDLGSGGPDRHWLPAAPAPVGSSELPRCQDTASIPCYGQISPGEEGGGVGYSSSKVVNPKSALGFSCGPLGSLPGQDKIALRPGICPRPCGHSHPVNSHPVKVSRPNLHIISLYIKIESSKTEKINILKKTIVAFGGGIEVIH